MKILIIGGGIGGLAAAAFLERKGFSVTLIERAPEFKHIGFGMSVFGNGRKMLKELGIEKEVVQEGYEIPWLKIIKPDGSIVGAPIDFTGLVRVGEPTITIERAALQGALLKNLAHID